jgi:hypothetical protein
MQGGILMEKDVPPPRSSVSRRLWRWVCSNNLTLIGLLVAVVGTVGTLLAIPWFYDDRGAKVQAELRTRYKESAAFQLGHAKVIYTKLQDTLQYRLQEKADPDWVNNPTIQTLKIKMTPLLAHSRQLYCTLDAAPCSITDDTTWPEIYAKLDTMLLRQYVGRIQNAYHIGELVGLFDLETTFTPAEHDIGFAIFSTLARDDSKTIWVEGEILLPDNASLRQSVRALYDYAKRNHSPSAHDFKTVARPILSYYRE